MDGRVWWATADGVSKNRTKPRPWVHILSWPKNAFEFFHNTLQKSLDALFGQPNVRGKSVPKKVSWVEYPWLRAHWQRNKKEIKKRVKENEGFLVDQTDARGHWLSDDPSLQVQDLTHSIPQSDCSVTPIITCIARGTRMEKWINQNNPSPTVYKQDTSHALKQGLPGSHTSLRHMFLLLLLGYLDKCKNYSQICRPLGCSWKWIHETQNYTYLQRLCHKSAKFPRQDANPTSPRIPIGISKCLHA